MSLKEARKRKNITQQEMAEFLGISLRAYQYMENRNDVKVKIALSISVILGETIEEIFKED